MSFIFLPLSDSIADNPLLEKLQTSANTSSSLEALIGKWLRYGKSLTIGLNTTTPAPCLSVMFPKPEDSEHKCVAVASLPVEAIEHRFSEIMPLSERNIRKSKSGIFRLSKNWKSARDERYGIGYDTQFEKNILPSYALTPLILSYAFTSSGFAKIGPIEIPKAKGMPFLNLELTFLGKIKRTKVTLQESFLVHADELEKFGNGLAEEEFCGFH